MKNFINMLLISILIGHTCQVEALSSQSITDDFKQICGQSSRPINL